MVAAGGKCIPARNQGRFTKRFADLVVESLAELCHADVLGLLDGQDRPGALPALEGV